MKLRILLLATALATLRAQTPAASDPLKIGNVVVTASIRSRL